MALTLGRASFAPTCSEEELIAAARAGDDRAFEEIYSRYRDRIHAFILGRVHDHGRAEDIGQEVFISALRRLRSSDREIAFKPWIYEIAKNACIDEFRRGQRSHEVSLDADEGLVGGQRALLSVAPTPPAAVESKQRLDDLRGAFGGLSENHHQLLVMREFEGLSYDQIGARTGMSRQMVESSLFRARRKLTEEYDELTSGRRCLQVQGVIDDGRAQSERSFGVRERRQISRHLAHCQPCRVKAHLAGVDEALLKPRSIAAKIAALLPFPLWRWPWRGGGSAKNAVARSGGSHPFAVQTLQNAAAVAEPAAAGTTFGGAAIAAAVLALAGAGGGVVTALANHGHAPARPAAAQAHKAGSSAASSSAHAGARAAGLSAGSAATLRSDQAAGLASGGTVGSRQTATNTNGSHPVGTTPPAGKTGSGSPTKLPNPVSTVKKVLSPIGVGTVVKKVLPPTGVGTVVKKVLPPTGVGTVVKKVLPPTGVGTVVKKVLPPTGVGTVVKKVLPPTGVGTVVKKVVKKVLPPTGIGTVVTKVVKKVLPPTGIGTVVTKVVKKVVAPTGLGTIVKKVVAPTGLGTVVKKVLLPTGLGTAVKKVTTGTLSAPPLPSNPVSPVKQVLPPVKQVVPPVKQVVPPVTQVPAPVTPPAPVKKVVQTLNPVLL
jgi:RNA polymerase sigma factor (sigma-70 family)